MFKKQILKLKHGKRFISAGLLGLMLVGSMTAFAGNTVDLSYNAYVGEGGYVTLCKEKRILHLRISSIRERERYM